MTKKSLRDIIGSVLAKSGNAATAKFLDDIMGLGFRMAFEGGLSFNLGDVLIPEEKEELINKANDEINSIKNSYLEGWITLRKDITK